MKNSFDIDTIPDESLYIPPGQEEAMAVYQHILGTPEYESFKRRYNNSAQDAGLPSFSELSVVDKIVLFEADFISQEDHVF